jgi:hypothetical protein
VSSLFRDVGEHDDLAGRIWSIAGFSARFAA